MLDWRSAVLIPCLCLSVACGKEQGEAGRTEAGESELLLDDEDQAGSAAAGSLVAPELPDTGEYKLRKGGTVSEIAKERYGSSHYTRLVLLHNGIRDAATLPIGKTIKTPPMIDVFHASGVMTVVNQEMLLLLKARAQFRAVEGPVVAAYGDKPAWEAVEVPANVEAALNEVAETLEAAADGFEKERAEVQKTPEKLIVQLREAAKIARKMGEGTQGTPDVDGIHQRLGNAMSYAILWHQHDYK